MELVAEGYLNQDEPEDRLGGEESAPAIEPVPLRRARKQISRKLTITPIELVGLERAKRGFSTRRVDWSQVCTLVDGPIRPRTGDLVLAQVDRLHYQRRIELPNGRKANLSPGDTIVVAYGDRYATDQFEAEVPLDLGRTNLVATGGVALLSWSLAPGSGALPSGLSLGAGGLLSGIPTASGTFNFKVRVTDAEGVSADRSYVVAVNPVPLTVSANSFSRSYGATNPVLSAMPIRKARPKSVGA